MEIRANYIIVGVFTLFAILGGLIFTLWIAKQGQGIPMTQYIISFNESVRGLSVNSDVFFTGIRVGSVTDIKISQTTPGAVSVRISIAADTPVRLDSRARLELQGLTGTSVITVSGGSAASPLMDVPPGGLGNLDYEPSPFASVLAQVPDTIAAANQLLQRMDTMFSEQNAQSVTTILQSMATVSSTLAARADSIDSILRHADSATKNFEVLANTANKAIATDVRNTSEAMSRIAKRIDNTVSIMEPGLKQFSKEGLADMRMLMVEMRNLVHVLTRVGQKLESDPRRFLFGEPVQEYQSR